MKILKLLIFIVALVSLYSCEEDDEVLSNHTIEFIQPNSSQVHVEGDTVAFQVRVTDEQNQPAGGVSLNFEHSSAGISFENAVTNSQGLVNGSVVLKFEYNYIRASIEGTDVWAEVQLTGLGKTFVKFEEDIILLDSIESEAYLFAGVYLQASGELLLGNSVDFSVTTPDIIELYPTSSTGSYRGMEAIAHAVAFGETMVIATNFAGGIDTAYIYVGDR